MYIKLPNLSHRGSLYTINDKVLFVRADMGERHYFVLGFPQKGIEEIFFPESLLDDWGHEITGLKLFSWIRENGNDFPRAELFGCNADGEYRQYFLRELEYWSKYSCLVSSSPIQQPTDGKKLDIVVSLVDNCHSPRRVKSSARTEFPFSKASVRWWEMSGEISPEILERIASESS